MRLMLVFYIMILSSLNYVTEQKFIVAEQNDNNNGTTTTTTTSTILRTTNYKADTKKGHLNLWLKDLFGKIENSNVTKIENENLSEKDEYVLVPIYKEKTNDVKLTSQLDLLQSQGTSIKEILQGIDNNTEDVLIKLKKKKNEEILDKKIEYNEYTGDINEKGIGNISSSTSIMESSNVHKVINSTLLTNKVFIPWIENSNKSVVVASAIRNTSSWVNDNLPSETMAQIQANTLRTTGIPLSTLTALNTDIHLLQGNNQTADQMNIGLAVESDIRQDGGTTTQKNLILIEKSNSNLNITNKKNENKIVANKAPAEPGNYMQVDPGNTNNCMTDLRELLKMIQPLVVMEPQVPALNVHTIQHAEIHKQIESEFEKWQPRHKGKILHQDIGITINCVICEG